MKRVAMFVFLAGAMSIVALPHAQQAPTRDKAAAAPAVGTAVISGTVVSDEQSSQPVRRATVRLSSADAFGGRMTVTDDAGRFAFANMPAGRYILSTSKPGMIAAAYGAKRPQGAGSAILLTDSQRMTGVVMKMLRGAVVTGTIRDANGRPVALANVSLMQYRLNYQNGERTLMSARGGFGSRTDDRGVYRVYDLWPGDYLVVVAPTIGVGRGGNDMHQVTAAEVQWAARQLQSSGGLDAGSPAPALGPNVVYAPVFFPGTPVEANAATITLSAGEERTGVDIPLMLVPTAKLSGTVASADGTALPDLRVNLVQQDRIEGIPFSGFIDAAVKDGAFTVSGLAPGTYTVTARAAAGASRAGRGAGAGTEYDAAIAALFAIDDVTITGEDATISLVLRSGVTVSGKLTFEGTSKPPADLTKIRVSMTAVANGRSAVLGVPSVAADANGEFKFIGVSPGKYRLYTQASGGWQPKAGAIDGHDAYDMPFEVRSDNVTGATLTFTDRSSEISGAILDSAGHPAPEYWVIVFPADKAMWVPQSRRVQARRPGTDGKFSFANMPAGEYLIGAAVDVEQNQWFDSAFLAQLISSGAVKIALGEGEKKVQDVKIGG